MRLHTLLPALFGEAMPVAQIARSPGTPEIHAIPLCGTLGDCVVRPPLPPAGQSVSYQNRLALYCTDL